MPPPRMVYKGSPVARPPIIRIGRTGRLALAASVLFVLTIIGWGYVGVQQQDRSNDPENTGLARWTAYPDRAGNGGVAIALVFTTITVAIGLAAVISGLWNRRQRRAHGQPGVAGPRGAPRQPAGQRLRSR